MPIGGPPAPGPPLGPPETTSAAPSGNVHRGTPSCFLQPPSAPPPPPPLPFCAPASPRHLSRPSTGAATCLPSRPFPAAPRPRELLGKDTIPTLAFLRLPRRPRPKPLPPALGRAMPPRPGELPQPRCPTSRGRPGLRDFRGHWTSQHYPSHHRRRRPGSARRPRRRPGPAWPPHPPAQRPPLNRAPRRPLRRWDCLTKLRPSARKAAGDTQGACADRPLVRFLACDWFPPSWPDCPRAARETPSAALESQGSLTKPRP